METPNNENLITPELYDAHPEYLEMGLKVGDPIPQSPSPTSGSASTDHITGGSTNPTGQASANTSGNSHTASVTSANISGAQLANPNASEFISKPIEVEKVFFFREKKVIKDGWRTIGDKAFHHIQTEDGSSFDLTETEYEIMKNNPQ